MKPSGVRSSVRFELAPARVAAGRSRSGIPGSGTHRRRVGPRGSRPIRPAARIGRQSAGRLRRVGCWMSPSSAKRPRRGVQRHRREAHWPPQSPGAQPGLQTAARDRHDPPARRQLSVDRGRLTVSSKLVEMQRTGNPIRLERSATGTRLSVYSNTFPGDGPCTSGTGRGRSGTGFEGEIHHGFRWRRCPIVHQAQIEARSDLANLVAVVLINPRGLAVVENERRSAVMPATAGINLPADDGKAKETVDGGALTGLEYLPLPDQPRASGQGMSVRSPRRQERGSLDRSRRNRRLRIPGGKVLPAPRGTSVANGRRTARQGQRALERRPPRRLPGHPRRRATRTACRL